MNGNPLEGEEKTTPAPAPASPVFDPRRRIRELLAIPDRDRSDAEWDELNELEIQTAPGNRISGQPSYGGYTGKPGGGGPKNRFKGNKQRKPGVGGPPGSRPPNHNKPKPPRPS